MIRAMENSRQKAETKVLVSDRMCQKSTIILVNIMIANISQSTSSTKSKVCCFNNLRATILFHQSLSHIELDLQTDHVSIEDDQQTMQDSTEACGHNVNNNSICVIFEDRINSGM